MDRKWFPDFVRVVDEFEYTQHAEGAGAEPEKGALRPPPDSPDAEPSSSARRGDTRYEPFRPLGDEEYAALRVEFERSERLELLDR